MVTSAQQQAGARAVSSRLAHWAELNATALAALQDEGAGLMQDVDALISSATTRVYELRSRSVPVGTAQVRPAWHDAMRPSCPSTPNCATCLCHPQPGRPDAARAHDSCCKRMQILPPLSCDALGNAWAVKQPVAAALDPP